MSTESQLQQIPEQDERMQAIYDRALEDILQERAEHGLAVDENELLLVLDYHVQNQIQQAALELFYQGKLRFEKRDGKLFFVGQNKKDAPKITDTVPIAEKDGISCRVAKQ